MRRLAIGAAILAGLTVVIQLAYPTGRILPLVTVEGISIGGASLLEARDQLNKHYSKASLVLKTDDKTFTKSFDEIGIEPKSWDTARSAARYTFGQRLIPFSSVYIMIKRDTLMQVGFDDDRLQYFAGEVQKEAFVPAVNATVAVTDGTARLVPAKVSKTYAQYDVEKTIRAARFTPAVTLRIVPKTAPAERTDDAVKSVLSDAQRAVNTPLTLKVQDETISVTKSTIGEWLDFTEDPQTKKLQLTLKTDNVTKYLDGIQTKIYKAPGTTRVQIIDNREVGRVAGESGRGINIAKAINLLNDTLRAGQETTVTVPIATLAPKLVYDRQYSNTDAGLTAMLNDLAAAKGFGISIMELQGRSANVNGNKRFVAASTYKLYVAYAVFKEIEAGRMTWNESISGKSVAECFDQMIRVSNNPCTSAFGDKIGWQNIENQMKALGLSNTGLIPPTRFTTANDLSLFLYKLQNGSLVSAADQARLINVMKVQIYRSGIPAGTGLGVADKVGFIDSYLHDAGIVYGPRGPYVLVIMTNGSSWSAIADAAKQINTFLNR